MKRRFKKYKLIDKTILTGFMICIVVNMGLSQTKAINFYRTNLKGVLKQAKDENRFVFIDTYATWCKPCKRMDKVFRDKDLSTYFNNNFISYKANMDVDRDKEFLKSEYSVVFLPTLIILDPRGKVVFRTDKEITAPELLMAGKRAINPASYSVSETFVMNEKVVLKKEDHGSAEKIVRIVDKDELISPNLLREEAYFRLELMDGSHMKAADEYLDSQKDWSTQSNTDFIMDFTEMVDSKRFNYIVKNRDLFDSRYGKERVERLLNMVVYGRLQNGFPRASLAEAEQLYKKIKVGDPYAYANNYIINRMFFEKKTVEIVETTRQYLENRPGDITIAFKVASYIIDQSDEFSSSDHSFARGIASDLLSHDENNISYQKLLLKYYINKGDCKKVNDLSSNFEKKSTKQEHISDMKDLVKSCNDG